MDGRIEGGDGKRPGKERRVDEQQVEAAVGKEGWRNEELLDMQQGSAGAGAAAASRPLTAHVRNPLLCRPMLPCGCPRGCPIGFACPPSAKHIAICFSNTLCGAALKLVACPSSSALSSRNCYRLSTPRRQSTRKLLPEVGGKPWRRQARSSCDRLRLDSSFAACSLRPAPVLSVSLVGAGASGGFFRVILGLKAPRGSFPMALSTAACL